MTGILKAGDSVEKVLVVSKKIVRNFTGGEFLLFQFTDKDGLLKGIWWDPPKVMIEEISAGDVVRVMGTIQDYKGELQVKVNDIEKLENADYDPSLFLPSSSRDGEALYGELLGLISGIGNKYLRELLEAIFSDEALKINMMNAPAAKGWHHSYLGGLLEHILDMSTIAMAAARVYAEVDSDLLIAGVILHDLGKLQELNVTNHIEYSDRGRLLGHITLGVEFINDYIRGIDGFPDELEMKVKHMVLSHHGQLEHGSPVLPMTLEALLLSYIDNMDAQVRGTLQVLQNRSGMDGNWTEYVRLLDRFFYKDNDADGS